MHIQLTKAAEQKLHELDLADDQLPRIDANMKGGCSLAIEYLFIFDERRKNDNTYQANGIDIQVDHFTNRYLAEEIVTIDYTNEFLVISDIDFGSSC